MILILFAGLRFFAIGVVMMSGANAASTLMLPLPSQNGLGGENTAPVLVCAVPGLCANGFQLNDLQLIEVLMATAGSRFPVPFVTAVSLIDVAPAPRLAGPRTVFGVAATEDFSGVANSAGRPAR